MFAVLGLAACGNHLRTLEEDFREATELRRTEQFDRALPITDAALVRAERSGDLRAAWRFRILKADILLAHRKVPQALAVLDGYGDPPSGHDWAETRARERLLRGQAAYSQGHLAEAEKLLQQAADAAREARSPTVSAEVELRRGTLLVMQTRFDEARAALQQTIADSAKIPDPYTEAIAANNFGYALFTESRYDEAIPWFERAIVLSTRLRVAESVARADGNLGNCYARLGDYDNARLHYDRAQEAFARTGNRDAQQIWLGNAGNLLLDTEDYSAAVGPYTRAVAIARAVPDPLWTGRWLTNLASVSLELGDWEAAEKYNNEARLLQQQAGDKLYQANSLNNAARIAAGRNRFDESARLFREVLKSQAEDPAVSLEAHAGLADLYIREGQPNQAEAEFRAATDAIDRRGATLLKDDYKLSFLGSLIRFNRQYVDFLMARNQPERALEAAESSRSRVLAGRTGSLQRAARPGNSNDYRKIARDTGAVLLEFWDGKDRSYLWVITPDRIFSHVLPSRSVLHPLVETWRAVIASGRNPLEVAGGVGRQLYSALLAPVASDAPGKSRFILVPDEDLNSLNFESLPAGDDSARFWIEQSTVAIAPSLNYLATGGNRAGGNRAGGDRAGGDRAGGNRTGGDRAGGNRAGGNRVEGNRVEGNRVEGNRARGNRAEGYRAPLPPEKLLLIGDPESADPQYPKLEFASREIDSIKSAMAGTAPTVIQGAAARPASYADASPGTFGFIHFSAHASANPLSPLDSAVILSGPSDNCRLRARDVVAIPLTAVLVTISSCRSAGSRNYAGEGLVGFAWAFLKAGAGNVIAGLWDVNDRSTMELMSRLYSEVSAGSSIPDALRISKLALIHRGGAYAKPFYWAPFQLYTSGQIDFQNGAPAGRRAGKLKENYSPQRGPLTGVPRRRELRGNTRVKVKTGERGGGRGNHLFSGMSVAAGTELFPGEA